MFRIVPAETRLSKVRFTSGKDWFTYPYAYFSCGKCSFILTIVMNDLVRHENSTYTNLSNADIERIKSAYAFRKASDIVATSFLDFYCPECHSPIRIHYLGGELVGSRRMAYGYELRYIIEESTDKE